MYSFLIPVTIQARPRPEDAYQFFTYQGSSSVVVNFRGKDISIGKGDRFGVRKSGNGKHIRLIFPDDPNRVITLDMDTAKKLARGVAK